MKVIYLKQKYPIVIGTIIFNDEEIKQFLNGNILTDYPQYTKDDVIVLDQTNPYTNPILLPDNTIREMTKIELIEAGRYSQVQLESGEYIQDGKLKSIPSPSKYHTWNTEQYRWEIDMEATKKIFRHKFQDELVARMYKNFEYEDKIFQFRATDEMNFLRVKSAIDIAGSNGSLKTIKKALKILRIPITQELEEQITGAIKIGKLRDFILQLPIQWRLADNTIAQITFNDVNNIYLFWILKGTVIQQDYTDITIKLAEAQTVEELEALKLPDEEEI